MNKRILLVDNHPDMLDHLTSLIRKAIKNATIIGATDGLEALALLKEHSPDLLITDYRLPKINGAGLIKAAREYGYNREIILMAGNRLHDVKIGTMKHQMPQQNVYFFSKTCEVENMIANAKKYLENSSKK